MDDTEKRALIERYWESSSTGQDLTDEIYHEDAVLEFPQSGERFEGVANFREWPALNVLEFRRDKVVRETIYVTEPWEAPEWRKRWRAAP